MVHWLLPKPMTWANGLRSDFPKQIIEELNLKEGDKVSFLRKGSNLELHPVDREFEEWAEAYRELNI